MGLFRILIRVLWVILILLGVRMLVQWVSRHVGQRSSERKKKAPADPTSLNRGAMARDPICGTFIDPDIGLRLKQAGEVHYFCSDECRQKFLDQESKS